jgi:hypothetical protein
MGTLLWLLCLYLALVEFLKVEIGDEVAPLFAKPNNKFTAG